MAFVNVNDPNFSDFLRCCFEEEEEELSGDNLSGEDDNLEVESDVEDEIEWDFAEEAV